MARGWNCPRCGAANDSAALNCSSCRLIRGAVVPSTGSYPPTAPESLLAAAPDMAPDAAPDAGPDADPGVEPGAVRAGAPAPAETPFWRRIPLQLVVVGVIALATAIGGWYFNASRSPTGEITKSGDLTASDLRVGDCFDLKDPTADEVGYVAARVCTDEHEFEMFFVGALPEGDYPAEAVFTSFVEQHCVPAFDTYVGKAYLESELDIYWLYPTADAWNEGDLSVQCAVYHPLVNRLIESLKGSSR